KLDGVDGVKTYAQGESFDVPAKSGFDIEIKTGICEYLCTFIS
ncbi:MAG: pyrimidine/purine nucleoside phosphorylase, partial [Verrucomicrobiia bacterium]